MASPDTLATMREQLAAAQADNRALREALVRKNMAIRVLAEESRSYIAWSKQMPFERAIDDAEAESTDMAALSRAPGSDDALREVCERVADVVRARFVDDEDGPQYGIRTRLEIEEAWRMNRAAIVSRILGPEGGKA